MEDNILKKIFFVSFCGIMLITLLITIHLISVNTNNEISNNYPTAMYSEIRYSQDDLVTKSDLIVRCTFKGDKETKMVSSKPKNNDESGFEAPVTTYKMKLIEVLKGFEDKDITINSLGGPDSYFEKGTEYLLYLSKNPDNTYKLVSFSQGLNKVKKSDKSDSDDSITIESKSNDKINYKELKEKIKEFKGEIY